MLERQYLIAIKRIKFDGNHIKYNLACMDVYDQFKEQFDYAWHNHKRPVLALYAQCRRIVYNKTFNQFMKALEIIAN